MELLISNDSFEAYKIESGILIREKKNSAKKVGLIVTIMGMIFLFTSLIPFKGLTADWITSIFIATFFYGGILLLMIGVSLFVIKGLVLGQPESIIDSNSKVVTLRGKEIPFSEMSEVTLTSSEILNRTINAILFNYNGRKKPLVSGTILTKDVIELEIFVKTVNKLLGKGK